jgi:hypothetical protein
VHEVDWHELDRAKTPVDAANKLVHRGSEVLVLLYILTRWNCELDQDDLNGMLVEIGEVNCRYVPCRSILGVE